VSAPATTVAVIGGGVAGLAAAWDLAKRGVSTVLLERSPRLGGLVETERPLPGVVLEHGADAVLADKPGGMTVLRELGLDAKLVRSGRAPRRAFVSTDGRLVPMPAGLFAFERRALFTMMTSPLLSPAAKLRLVVEPLGMRSSDPDESVASFFRRRLGAEVEEKLVAPMIRGIYGAPTDALGVRSVFPKLAGMEDRFGSVGLALLFTERSPRGAGLVALSGGMESIPHALAAAATERGARVRLGAGARSFSRRAGGFRIDLEDGSSLDAEGVLIATELSTAARLLAPLDGALASELAEIRATDAEVVSLAYPRAEVGHPLDGTGFVVGEPGRATLACTFASEKWDGRAPEGLAVFRSVLSGAPELGERDLVAAAHAELRALLGVRGEPTLTRVRRRRAALPLYGVGHRERIASVRARAEALGAIALAGNYLGGVGVPDAISSGLAASAALAAAARTERAPRADDQDHGRGVAGA
jgi:oxygen-dependent protoporphyrinogen oxidase